MSAIPSLEDLGPPSSQKSAQIAALPFSTPSFLQSAAKRVYIMAELREHVLKFLDMKTLRTLMCVKQRVMSDVANLVWHSVWHEQVTALASIPEKRRQIYAQAVVEVETSTSAVPEYIFHKAGGVVYAGGREELGYSQIACAAILKSLRTLVPGVRRIYFLTGHRNEVAWTATLSSTGSSDPSSPVPVTLPGAEGQIEVLECLRLRMEDIFRPRLGMGVEPQPPIGLTISHRFELVLNPNLTGHSSATTNSWLSSLRNDPIYGFLHKIIDLGPLQVSLKDICSLIQRQLNFGHETRLEYIISRHILLFSINHFVDFARIASPSLTQIRFADEEHLGADGRGNGITFHDLHTLIPTIRTYLPCLKMLELAILGGDAELECLPLLSIDKLEGYGTITHIRIHTPSVEPCLNTIRCLAPLCASEVRLGIGGDQFTDYSQSDYLEHLRDQTSRRRAYLSVVDFSSLGVCDFEGVMELEYEEDSRPLSQPASKVASGLREMRIMGDQSTTAIDLVMQDMERAYRGKRADLEAMSTLPKTAERILEAEGLLESMRAVQKEMEEAKKRISEAEAVIYGEAIQDATQLVESWRGMNTGIDY